MGSPQRLDREVKLSDNTERERERERERDKEREGNEGRGGEGAWEVSLRHGEGLRFFEAII